MVIPDDSENCAIFFSFNYEALQFSSILSYSPSVEGHVVIDLISVKILWYVCNSWGSRFGGFRLVSITRNLEGGSFTSPLLQGGLAKRGFNEPSQAVFLSPPVGAGS